MKKLLLFAMLCIGINLAKAQSLTINNYTGCDVHYLMYGDDPMGNCGASYRSIIYTLAGSGVPGSVTSIVYSDPSGVPPPGMTNSGGFVLGSTGWFSHLRFPQCNPAFCPGCGTSSVAVGDGSCGASNTASQSFVDATTCMPATCGTVSITYTNVGGNITVDIL